MAGNIEYIGQYANQPYKVCTENCSDFDNPFPIQNLALRYPHLKNIWYGWACCETTERPPFMVKNAVNVLNDIWKSITRMDEGTYLIAADTKRILNIYHRRWLTKKNGFTVLESGQILSTYYVVVQKEAKIVPKCCAR